MLAFPHFSNSNSKKCSECHHMSSDPLVAHAFSPRWMNPKIYLFLQFSSMSLLLLLAPDFRCLLFLYGQCPNCRPSVDHGMGFMRSWGPCYQGVVTNNTLGWWSGCKEFHFLLSSSGFQIDWRDHYFKPLAASRTPVEQWRAPIEPSARDPSGNGDVVEGGKDLESLCRWKAMFLWVKHMVTGWYCCVYNMWLYIRTHILYIMIQHDI